MKPVYFFLGANSEEGFFSLYDQLLGGRLDDLMILKGGPGCGKSTFLRSLNLMNREIRGCRVEGEISYRGRNVNTKTENTYELRRSIGMVFQQPNPFRKSIRDNITFAPKRHGITDRDELDSMVEESLRWRSRTSCRRSWPTAPSSS